MEVNVGFNYVLTTVNKNIRKSQTCRVSLQSVFWCSCGMIIKSVSNIDFLVVKAGYKII